MYALFVCTKLVMSHGYIKKKKNENYLFTEQEQRSQKHNNEYNNIVLNLSQQTFIYD